MEVKKLYQISADVVIKHLNEEAREILLGRLYFPFISNIGDIFDENSDNENMKDILRDFCNRFPFFVNRCKDQTYLP